MKKRFQYIILIFGTIFLQSCTDSDSDFEINSLNDYIRFSNYVEGNEVIACAGSNITDDSINVFFYPAAGSSEFRYYQALPDAVKNDNSQYIDSGLEFEIVLENYLQRFIISEPQEAWGIVTFIINDKLHISNPIRLKPGLLPTEYNADLLSIDQSSATHPKFTWEDGNYGVNEIYFQIVAEKNKEVLSATYTYDLEFTYYDDSNVVLNLTSPVPPPDLKPGHDYVIFLMGISIDNWINFYSEKPYSILSE